MKKEHQLTQTLIREIFNYHVDGYLTWRIKPFRKCEVGSKAGTDDGEGYTKITLFGRQYREHVLVYVHHNGVWPSLAIDHINRKRDDNRIINLRLVTPFGNAQNRSIHCTNKSGVTGVHWCKSRDKWVAAIQINKKTYILGRHDCIIEAACHRLAAEQCTPMSIYVTKSNSFTFVEKYINRK